jgi:hypothetical protein
MRFTMAAGDLAFGVRSLHLESESMPGPATFKMVHLRSAQT